MDFRSLETFAGAADEVPEHLDALGASSADAAWEALDILRDIAVPSRARKDGPYCSAAPRLCEALVDGIGDFHEEVRGAVLCLVGDVVAANHSLVLEHADVRAALRDLHSSPLGSAVVAAVRARLDAIDDRAHDADERQRAGALFALAQLEQDTARLRSVVGARSKVERNGVLGHLLAFLLGYLHEEAPSDRFCEWLGSTLAPPLRARPEGAASAIARILPPELFPYFAGNLGRLAATRAVAVGGAVREEIADVLLDALDQGHDSVAEPAALAAMTLRPHGVRPDALDDLERRAIEVMTRRGLRVETLAQAGVPADPTQRRSWLQAQPTRTIDNPVPEGLAGASAGETLGSWIVRTQRAGDDPLAALRAQLTPADFADVLVSMAAREHDALPPPAADLFAAMVAAGGSATESARRLLDPAKVRRGASGDVELGWGVGAQGNAVLVALSRLAGSATLPPDLVPFVSFDGPPEWFSELMGKLRPEDRESIAIAGLDRMPLKRLRKPDLQSLARILAEARSARATKHFLDRLDALPDKGASVREPLAGVIRELGLEVPGFPG